MFRRLLRVPAAASDALPPPPAIDPALATDEQLAEIAQLLLETDSADAQVGFLATLEAAIAHRQVESTYPLLDTDTLESIVSVLRLRRQHNHVLRKAMTIVAVLVQSGWVEAIQTVLAHLDDAPDALTAGLSAVPNAASPNPSDAFWCRMSCLEMLQTLVQQAPRPLRVLKALLRSNAIGSLACLLAQEEEEVLRMRGLALIHALAHIADAADSRADELEQATAAAADGEMTSPTRQRMVKVELAMLLNYGNTMTTLISLIETRGGVAVPTSTQHATADAREEDVRLCAETLRCVLTGNPQALKYFLEADETLFGRLVCLLPRSGANCELTLALTAPLEGGRQRPDWLVSMECGLAVLAECMEARVLSYPGRSARAGMSAALSHANFVAAETAAREYCSKVRLQTPKLFTALQYAFVESTRSNHALQKHDRLVTLVVCSFASMCTLHTETAGFASSLAALRMITQLATAERKIGDDVVAFLGTTLPTILSKGEAATVEAAQTDAQGQDLEAALCSALAALTSTVTELHVTASSHETTGAADVASLPSLGAAYASLSRVVWMSCRLTKARVAGYLNLVAALQFAAEQLAVFNKDAAAGICAIATRLQHAAGAPDSCYHRSSHQCALAVVAAHCVTVSVCLDAVRPHIAAGGSTVAAFQIVLRHIRDATRQAASPTTQSAQCSAVRYSMRVLAAIVAACAICTTQGEAVRSVEEGHRMLLWAERIDAALAAYPPSTGAELSTYSMAAAVARSRLSEGTSNALQDAALHDVHASRVVRHHAAVTADVAKTTTVPEGRRWAALAPGAWCRLQRAHESVGQFRSLELQDADHRSRSQSPVVSSDLDRVAQSQAFPLFIPPPPPQPGAQVVHGVAVHASRADEGDEVANSPVPKNPVDVADDPPAPLPYTFTAAVVSESLWPLCGAAAQDMDWRSLPAFLTDAGHRAVKAAVESEAKTQLLVAQSVIQRLEREAAAAWEHARQKDALCALLEQEAAALRDANSELTEQLKTYRRRENQLKRVCNLGSLVQTTPPDLRSSDGDVIH
jgi:hypothetical protein